VVGALLLGITLFFVVVINFGTNETRLVCPGEVRRSVDGGNGVTTPATLYAQVERYRWFIFWAADNDAMISWEVQPGHDTGFGYYDESPFGTPIRDFNRTRDYGSWSSLSRRIHVQTALDGQEVVDGYCK
jgi:hypothetical protein